VVSRIEQPALAVAWSSRNLAQNRFQPKSALGGSNTPKSLPPAIFQISLPVAIMDAVKSGGVQGVNVGKRLMESRLLKSQLKAAEMFLGRPRRANDPDR
jgi:hypothetical protein